MKWLLKMSAEDYARVAEENIRELYREVENWRTKAEIIEKAERLARNQLAIYNQCVINERDNFKLEVENLRDKLKLASTEIASLTARLKEQELKNISDRRQASLENYRRECLRRQRSICDCPNDQCVSDGPGEDEIDG